MKRLLYITILLGVILMSAVSSLKWRQISDVVTTLTEINYLHGITGKPLTRSSADSIYNQIANNIDPHDSVYYKNESDAKYAPQVNANLTNPTVTTQTAGDNSTKAASTAFVTLADTKNAFDRAQALFGSTIKALPVGIVAGSVNTYTLVDNTVYGCVYNIESPITITGIKYKLNTQGAYTADQENSIAIFSLVNGVCTKVATTENVGTLWSAAANSTQTVALTSPYVASAGLYVVCILYNNSAQTTAPKIYSGQGWGLNIINTFASLNANAEKLYFTLAAQNAMPSTFNMSATSSADNPALLILY